MYSPELGKLLISQEYIFHSKVRFLCVRDMLVIYLTDWIHQVLWINIIISITVEINFMLSNYFTNLKNIYSKENRFKHRTLLHSLSNP